MPMYWPGGGRLTLRVNYSTVQYSTVQYSTVQYITVQYSTSGSRPLWARSTIHLYTIHYTLYTIHYTLIHLYTYTLYTYIHLHLYKCISVSVYKCIVYRYRTIMYRNVLYFKYFQSTVPSFLPLPSPSTPHLPALTSLSILMTYRL